MRVRDALGSVWGWGEVEHVRRINGQFLVCWSWGRLSEHRL